eukprot:1745363-Amphidinium_carterae.1
MERSTCRRLLQIHVSNGYLFECYYKRHPRSLVSLPETGLWLKSWHHRVAAGAFSAKMPQDLCGITTTATPGAFHIAG